MSISQLTKSTVFCIELTYSNVYLLLIEITLSWTGLKESMMNRKLECFQHATSGVHKKATLIERPNTWADVYTEYRDGEVWNNHWSVYSAVIHTQPAHNNISCTLTSAPVHLPHPLNWPVFCLRGLCKASTLNVKPNAAQNTLVEML